MADNQQKEETNEDVAVDESTGAKEISPNAETAESEMVTSETEIEAVEASQETAETVSAEPELASDTDTMTEAATE
ncbi:MAG TPA: hypothetical protein VIL33_06980, partial [Rhodothermia bacterium]